MSKNISFVCHRLALTILPVCGLLFSPANASIAEESTPNKDSVLRAGEPLQQIAPDTQQDLRAIIHTVLASNGDIFKTDAADPTVQDFILTKAVAVMLQSASQFKKNPRFSAAALMPHVRSFANKWVDDKAKALRDFAVPAKLLMGANRVNIYQPDIADKIQPHLSKYLTVQMLKNAPMTSKILAQKIKEDTKALQAALGTLTVDLMVLASKAELTTYTNNLLRGRGHFLSDAALNYFLTSAVEAMKTQDRQLNGKMPINITKLQEIIKTKVEQLPINPFYKSNTR